MARRAGVTHGLITRQFTSKEQLFRAAVDGLGPDPPGPSLRLARWRLDLRDDRGRGSRS
ncbi:helix-turn-helix domain-containing protein [Cryptosporangium japonicum]|uniref:helix-turn-helix domain-containing protein n=1 Tax=Cryptosporangium japonicum TaxID=80872 RepID=UPI0031D09FAB